MEDSGTRTAMKNTSVHQGEDDDSSRDDIEIETETEVENDSTIKSKQKQKQQESITNEGGKTNNMDEMKNTNISNDDTTSAFGKKSDDERVRDENNVSKSVDDGDNENGETKEGNHELLSIAGHIQQNEQENRVGDKDEKGSHEEETISNYLEEENDNKGNREVKDHLSNETKVATPRNKRLRRKRTSVSYKEDNAVIMFEEEKASRTRKTFTDHYNDLRAFKDKHGHMNVVDNKSLEKWMENQRYNCRVFAKAPDKTKRITRKSFELLCDLGFDFELKNKDPKGDELKSDTYSQLKKRKKQIPNQTEVATPLNKRSRRKRRSVSYREDNAVIMFEEGKASRSRKTFAEHYNDLLTFKDKHGHINVVDDRSLLSWINKQKPKCRAYLENPDQTSGLTQEQFELLYDLGLNFELKNKGPRGDELWEHYHHQLKQYDDEHGNVHVGEKANPKLYAWISAQRRAYRVRMEGGRSTLTDDRLKALEKLGVNLDPTGMVSKSKSKDCEGETESTNINLSTHAEIDDQNTTEQQESSSVDQNEGTEEYTEEGVSNKANQLRFDSELKNKESVRELHRQLWTDKYSELKKYKDEHGNTNVSRKTNSKLVAWITAQRKAYRVRMEGGRFGLTDDRLKALEKLGLNLDPTGMVSKSKNENCEGETESKNNNLSTHAEIDDQNTTEQQESSSVDQNESTEEYTEEGVSNKTNQLRLDPELKNKDSRRRQLWADNYNKLKKYKDEHGNTNVRLKTNPKLYAWIRNQRKAYRVRMEGGRSSLTDERLKALKFLGVNLDPIRMVFKSKNENCEGETERSTEAEIDDQNTTKQIKSSSVDQHENVEEYTEEDVSNKTKQPNEDLLQSPTKIGHNGNKSSSRRKKTLQRAEDQSGKSDNAEKDESGKTKQPDEDFVQSPTKTWPNGKKSSARKKRARVEDEVDNSGKRNTKTSKGRKSSPKKKKTLSIEGDTCKIIKQFDHDLAESSNITSPNKKKSRMKKKKRPSETNENDSGDPSEAKLPDEDLVESPNRRNHKRKRNIINYQEHDEFEAENDIHSSNAFAALLTNPLPPAAEIPTLPSTGFCKWSFSNSSRVLLAKFCIDDGKVVVTKEDELFLLKMMERPDITVISENLGKLHLSLDSDVI